QRLQRHFQAHVDEFRKVMTSVISALGEQVAQLRHSAETLSEAAETAAVEAASSASVSASAAGNSHAVSAATEGLSSSIKEIAGQAHRTNAVVEVATDEASQTD